jgi:type III secretion protein T
MNELSIVMLQQKMFVLAAYLPRISVAAVLLPTFAPKFMPALVRNAVCLCILLSAVLFTETSPLTSQVGATYFVGFVLKESLIGAAIGLAFAIVLWTGEVIGQLIDQQTGLTFTQNLDPVNGQSISVTAALIQKLWSVVFVAAGGLLLFADTLLTSYWLWPLDGWYPDLPRLLSLLLLQEISQLFSLSLLLAAPVLLVLFMFDVGLGFLGKAAPPLNLFMLGSTAKPVVALMVLMISLPFVLTQAWDVTERIARSIVVLMEANR